MGKYCETQKTIPVENTYRTPAFPPLAATSETCISENFTFKEPYKKTKHQNKNSKTTYLGKQQLGKPPRENAQPLSTHRQEVILPQNQPLGNAKRTKNAKCPTGAQPCKSKTNQSSENDHFQVKL